MPRGTQQEPQEADGPKDQEAGLVEAQTWGWGRGITEHRDPPPKSTLSAFPLVTGREESISVPMQDQLLDTKPYLSNPPKDPTPANAAFLRIISFLLPPASFIPAY